MTPGYPAADLIFEFILSGTASAHAVALDLEDSELRKVLAALTVFKGPGTFARDMAITLIRDELDGREGRA